MKLEQELPSCDIPLKQCAWNDNQLVAVNFCKKHSIRAIFRAILLIGIVIGALAYGALHEKEDDRTSSMQQISRLIEEADGDITSDDNCDDVSKLDSNALLVPYVAGVVYMFLAIAIVCDEFFVPALEELASENYMNLSMDVAGATLMAAGGSAPELFTSLIGTFQESEVGFGTIVGSAVFNVLFVIGMCAIFSFEVLSLTWWPLTRDCFCYSVGLCVLAIFCGHVSPGKIELWEAAVLFALYLCYVLVMKYSARMHQWILKSSNRKIVDVEDASDGRTKDRNDCRRTSTFRVGLMKLMMGKSAILERAGIELVSKLQGDIETIFKSVDESGDGFIDANELSNLFTKLNCPQTEKGVADALVELDLNGDGQIDLKEFSKWYEGSESRVRSRLKQTFDIFDVDKSGTIDKSEMRDLLNNLTCTIEEGDVESAINDISSGMSTQITYDELETWYLSHWNNIETENGEDDGPVSDNLKPPENGGLFDYIKWAVAWPIIAALSLTVPDVRQPGRARYCVASFFMSIMWIGCFTYFMVRGAEVIGNTLGIPMIVMGLVFLAAGTSVPDLLSSVIVARMGEGDMAVSSSLGSNIFDITVGLPVPWMLYCLWPSKPNTILIETEGIDVSILILLAMLVCVIIIVHLHGWKMTKSLGAVMFILYFVYLTVAVMRQLPFTTCT